MNIIHTFHTYPYHGYRDNYLYILFVNACLGQCIAGYLKILLTVSTSKRKYFRELFPVYVGEENKFSFFCCI